VRVIGDAGVLDDILYRSAGVPAEVFGSLL